jgi:egghead protein (zeste-white 4 protein)
VLELHALDRPPAVLRPLARPRLGPAGRFRLAVVISLAAVAVGVQLARGLVWGDGRPPVTAFEHVVSHLELLWALPAIHAALSLAGFLSYRGLPERAAPATPPPPCPKEVSFRIVSRGTNVDALRASLSATRREAAAAGLRHRIEVVTDVAVDLEPGPDLVQFVVPPGYRTANETLYKARALQYALEHSDLPADGWILHLDEESHPSQSLIRGITRAIAEEEASGALRIGQGAILYHRNLGSHPALTLADMVRTGDDLGRFHLQHRLGYTLFGLHGSFILVRNSVERIVGFDLGPEGSITEDAFWALCQMKTGTRCRWVDGYLHEQAPRSARDFVRQRRRWFAGIVRVVAFADTTAWLRAALALFTFLWATTWLALLYAYLQLALGLHTPPVLALLGDFSLATYITTYVIGLHVNLRECPSRPLWKVMLLYVAQVALLPVFTALEALGPLTGLIRPERGFTVIAK